MQINTETIKFLKVLETLTVQSGYGFADWRELSKEEINEFEGVIYDSNNDCMIPCDILVDAEHKDIISFYGEPGSGYSIRVVPSEEGPDENGNYPGSWPGDITKSYFEIHISFDHTDDIFVIHDGDWYEI